MAGGGGGRRWPVEVAVAGGRRLWSVAVVAGEEGRKGYIGKEGVYWK